MQTEIFATPLRNSADKERSRRIAKEMWDMIHSGEMTRSQFVAAMANMLDLVVSEKISA